MKTLLLFVIWVCSTSAFAGKFNLIGTCIGQHSSGTKLQIMIYTNSKRPDLVTVGQKGDSDQQPYEAGVYVGDGFIAFDLEFEKNSLELGAELKEGVTTGVKFETNNPTLKEIEFTCSVDL